jgi:hypothetical protein
MTGTSPYVLRAVTVLHKRQGGRSVVTNRTGPARPHTVGLEAKHSGPLRPIPVKRQATTGRRIVNFFSGRLNIQLTEHRILERS